MKVLLSFLVLIFFVTNAQAQEIEATLGGNTSTDGFSVKNLSGTTLFRVNGLGNVGIGTTDPTTKLQLGSFSSGDVFISLKSAGGNQFRNGIKFRQFNDGGGFDIVNDERFGSLGLNFIRHFFNGVADDSATALFVDKLSGNVGIGTTTPGYKLSVSGNTDNIFAASIENQSSTGWGLEIRTLDNSASRSAFEIYTGNTFRFCVRNNGNVGIGTTNPDQLLSVNGDASKIGGGSWSVFSDLRLKQDISTFQDGLSVLKGIRPVTFRYNGKLGYPTGKTYVGIVAQEIQTVAPYTVDSFKVKLNPEDTAETDILRFDPNALTYISINAIKELSAENQQLRKDLDELKAMVISLIAEKNSVDTKLIGELR